MKTTELAEDLTSFLEYLSHEKRMSPHTVTNYQRDLKAFLSFCKHNDLTAWPSISSQHIRQYSAVLHQKELSGRSIQRALSSLRGLFRFLIREGKVVNNPAQVVQAPKSQKRLPASLDVDQMNSLLNIDCDNDDAIAMRDKAIMELFYSSGLRLAELAALNLRDIDYSDQLVYVTGKGKKSRTVPVGKMAIKALNQWLNVRGPLAGYEQSALFISRQGQRLGVRAIQKRLQHWGHKQGVSDKVHPHRLRHAFASHMLESSGDLRAVQELLGHADISTTQIYTHVDFQHLAKVYDAAHPRAKKK